MTIDFAGTLDGEALSELKADDYLLELGSKRFVPGFEEQVAGMKKGEKKDISVTFPADYSESKMAGKNVVFSITLKELKEQKLPELNEEFVKNFDKYNTLDDLKSEVRKSMEEQCKRQSDAKLKDSITEVLLAANAFEAPASLVQRQIFYMIADTQKRMRSAGMDEKSAMELSFRMHDQFKTEAEKTVRAFLLFKKIAEKEAVAVSDEDMDNHIKELSEIHHVGIDSVKSIYEDEEKKESLKAEILQKKVFDFIEQRANIKVVEKIGMGEEAVA